ncbi:MAG: hypothetical protein LUE64_07400 [Candidatus Gastranaerophilales bacterium]|nr:hypothetical protein [Candidatus Gastranaerophilales bacterium]
MQVDAAKLQEIPKNTYLVVEKDYDGEDHVIEKKPGIGARIVADKLTNDIFSYAPKGMKGSKNSNFYEFLSLGLVPNLIGSGMLILVSNALNNIHTGKSSAAASMTGTKFAGGVILYAAGKWLGNKIINKGTQALTGIDLEMPYKKVVHELPEYPGDTNTTSVEFHRVFESSEFPRFDLLNKMGEQNNQRQQYYDKITKKMGYKTEPNASDQIAQDKIRDVIVKSTAAKSVSSYIWAALGCAIAAQEPFGTYMKYPIDPGIGKKIKDFPKETWRVLKESTKSLSKTTMGKVLMAGAAASSAFGILNTARGFKVKENKQKSCVDFNKEYMEN